MTKFEVRRLRLQSLKKMRRKIHRNQELSTNWWDWFKKNTTRKAGVLAFFFQLLYFLLGFFVIFASLFLPHCPTVGLAGYN